MHAQLDIIKSYNIWFRTVSARVRKERVNYCNEQERQHKRGVLRLGNIDCGG